MSSLAELNKGLQNYFRNIVIHCACPPGLGETRRLLETETQKKVIIGTEHGVISPVFSPLVKKNENEEKIRRKTRRDVLFLMRRGSYSKESLYSKKSDKKARKSDGSAICICVVLRTRTADCAKRHDFKRHQCQGPISIPVMSWICGHTSKYFFACSSYHAWLAAAP